MGYALMFGIKGGTTSREEGKYYLTSLLEKKRAYIYFPESHLKKFIKEHFNIEKKIGCKI